MDTPAAALSGNAVQQEPNDSENCKHTAENDKNKPIDDSKNGSESEHKKISSESVLDKEGLVCPSIDHKDVSTDKEAQNDLLKQGNELISMERSKSMDAGEKTAIITDCSDRSNFDSVDSMQESQVVYLDGGIIDGQDIRIPLSSMSETETIHSTNSPLENTNQYPQSESLDCGIVDGQDIRIPLSSMSETVTIHSTNSLLKTSQYPQSESMVIDSVEKHVPCTSNLISSEDLRMPLSIDTSQMTSDHLIKQSLSIPSTSQNNVIEKPLLFTLNENLPTNCPLASIDKKISEIEATINIMEKKLPSSASRIIFEEAIFPSTSHGNDETNDLSLRLDSSQENTTSNVFETSSNVTDDNQTLGSEWYKAKKVDIYTEDRGPKMYNVTGNIVTPPLIPKKLTEAFSSLPIFGRPTTRAGLGEFQMNKIREFVGCGLNNEEFDALMDYCSPEHLKTGKELTMDAIGPGHGFLSMDKNLMNTPNEEPKLSLHRKHRLRMRKDIKNNYVKRMKYRGIRMMPLNHEDDDATPQVTIGEPLQPGNDILFRVRVYRPFKYNPLDKYLTRTRHSVFNNDILLLGRQKLSQLRDRIMCCNDVDMRVDISEAPDDLPPSTAKDVFPSGFLFINNVFYVDTRTGCHDYSAPLRAWASKKGIGDFQSKDMCNVRLDELVIKLGHPEVYLHQGSCEHLFLFSEVRLLSAADPLRVSQYPRHTALSQNQTVYCTTCAEFAAKWIVVGCKVVPFDPAFFCDKCFKLYMYKDGQRLGEFKAYLYRGNEIK